MKGWWNMSHFNDKYLAADDDKISLIQTGKIPMWTQIFQTVNSYIEFLKIGNHCFTQMRRAPFDTVDFWEFIHFDKVCWNDVFQREIQDPIKNVKI